MLLDYLLRAGGARYEAFRGKIGAHAETVAFAAKSVGCGASDSV